MANWITLFISKHRRVQRKVTFTNESPKLFEQNGIAVSWSYKKEFRPEAKKIVFKKGKLTEDKPYDPNFGGRTVEGAIPKHLDEPMDLLNISAVMTWGDKNSNLEMVLITDCFAAEQLSKGQHNTCEKVRSTLKQ